jgi:hypothetical protein
LEVLPAEVISTDHLSDKLVVDLVDNGLGWLDKLSLPWEKLTQLNLSGKLIISPVKTFLKINLHFTKKNILYYFLNGISFILKGYVNYKPHKTTNI